MSYRSDSWHILKGLTFKQLWQNVCEITEYKGQEGVRFQLTHWSLLLIEF